MSHPEFPQTEGASPLMSEDQQADFNAAIRRLRPFMEPYSEEYSTKVVFEGEEDSQEFLEVKVAHHVGPNATEAEVYFSYYAGDTELHFGTDDDLKHDDSAYHEMGDLVKRIVDINSDDPESTSWLIESWMLGSNDVDPDIARELIDDTEAPQRTALYLSQLKLSQGNTFSIA